MGFWHLIFRRFSIGLGALLLLCALMWVWAALQQRESTLVIHPLTSNIGTPDGFYVWHHLDANGIRFKSITPQNDGLMITFGSSDQSAAAKEVLNKTLPRGYIIAQQDGDPALMPQWLSRLRDTSSRFG